MNPTKHGVLLDPEDAMMMRDLINTHIEQLKAKIRAEGLNKENYRHIFARLLSMRRRYEYVIGSMKTTVTMRVPLEPESETEEVEI